MTVEHEVHIRIVQNETGFRMTCAICRSSILSIQTVNSGEIKKAAELAGKLAVTHYCAIQPRTQDAGREERPQ